jgi:MFS family permease
VIEAAVSLVIIGVFESVLHPTAATVVVDVVAGPRVREHFALTRVASNAGQVIGPALGALLAQRSLGLVFVGAAVALLAGAVTVAFFLPETRVAGLSTEEDDDEITAIFAVLRDRRLAALLLPIALIGIASSWIETVLPLYAADAGSLTPAGVGLLFTYAALLGVVCQLPLTTVSAHISTSRLILASGTALALALAGLSISPVLPVLVVAVSLLTLSQMLAGPVTQAMSSDLAPARSRATTMAAYSAVNDLRDAAGPAIGTGLYAAAASLPWLAGVPITLAATLLLARTARAETAAP